MNQLDSLFRQQLELLLQTTDDISHHTNMWDGLLTGGITILTILASVATIAGLSMVWIEIRRRHYTRARQALLLKDLIRHLFVNSAILEVLEIKSKNNWNKVRPAEGVILRFSVLDDDLKLGDICVRDEQFIRLHSLRAFLRNYNISVQIAEKSLNSKTDSIEEKKALIADLWKRIGRLVDELIELGVAAKLFRGTLKNTDQAKCEVAKFIIDYYSKENINIKPIKLTDRKTPKDVFDNPAFGLKEDMDKRITKRMEDIRVINF